MAKRKRAPTQNEKHIAAAEHYFAAWPHERAMVLAQHEREGARLPALLDVPDVDAVRALRTDGDPFANATDERKAHLSRAFRWLAHDRGNFGGTLGAALSELFPCPIAIETEFDELLAETHEQLRARPPVSIGLGAEATHSAIVITAARYYVVEPQKFADSPASASFRAVIAELSTSDATSPKVRALYRTFAREFWSWLREIQSPLSPNPIAELPAHRAQTEPFYGRDALAFATSADPLAFGAHRALSSSQDYQMKDGVYFLDEPFSGVRFSFSEFTDGTKPDVPTLTVVEDLNWLDPQTSICHEAIIGKWLHALRSGTLRSSGAVAIHVDEILELRGFKRHHHGGFKREQKLDIAKRIVRIESILAHGTYTDPQGKKHHLKGRLVNLTVDSEEDLLGDKIPYEFLVKPGDAAWDFYASGEYLADYYLALARLDTRQGVGLMAYQIGRYLMHQYRIRETHGNFDQPMRVRTICEGARVEIEAKANNQPRFNKYFEKALDKLRDIGIIRGWHYVPGSEEKLPELGRGWFKKWLENGVIILPPETVLERAAIRANQRLVHLEASKRARKRALKKG